MNTVCLKARRHTVKQNEEFEPIKKWWKKRTESDVCWKVNIKTIIERGYDLDIKNPIKKEETQINTSVELLQMLQDSLKKSNDLLAQITRDLT